MVQSFFSQAGSDFVCGFCCRHFFLKLFSTKNCAVCLWCEVKSLVSASFEKNMVWFWKIFPAFLDDGTQDQVWSINPLRFFLRPRRVSCIFHPQQKHPESTFRKKHCNIGIFTIPSWEGSHYPMQFGSWEDEEIHGNPFPLVGDVSSLEGI